MTFDRGQSDLLQATVVWASVACFLRNRFGWMAFAATAVTTMKGYPVVLTAGLTALAIKGGGRLNVAFGILAALVTCVVPVADLLPWAQTTVPFRARQFWPVWYNHSFVNVFHGRWPDAAYVLARTVTAVGLLVSGLCLWRAARRGVAEPEARFWALAFATSSLATMIGTSNLSVSYNLMNVVPGALLTLANLPQRSRNAVTMLGVSMLALSMLALLVVRGTSETRSPAAWGLLGSICGLGILAAAGGNHQPPPGAPLSTTRNAGA